MAAESAVIEEGLSPGQRPLVAVTFQRNVRRKEKYLEAEPKALGITQIGLSVYQILCVGVLLSKGLNEMPIDIPFFISSIVVLIAGSVAVGAQNLHLPTLRACLAMQILACIATIFNFICVLVKMEGISSYCWRYYYENSTTHHRDICQDIANTQNHLFAEGLLIEATLMAISVTLAAYCCKVVNCCAPSPKMPVITVHAPPEQEETNADNQ